MEKIGADKTPHEARHTFETFLDDAKANRKCIDMLMGHKSKDVGNRVYNHKTIEQLRETVELLVWTFTEHIELFLDFRCSVCYSKDRRKAREAATLNVLAKLLQLSRHYCSSGGYFLPLKIS